MRKTEKTYWDQGYGRKQSVTPVDLSPALNRVDRRFADIFHNLRLAGKKILEIGGGGSAWLARLTLDHPDASLTCLDYAPQGCSLMHSFVAETGVSNLNIVQADMFDGPSSGDRFDIVYSLGVVEHFDQLENALMAKANFLSPNGKMLTVIPNLSGSIGFLVKHLNRSIYAIHVPHDLASFRKGHELAGLKIEESGYLGSNGFGVISGCFEKPEGFGYYIYVWLSRLTKLLSMFENRFFELPVSKAFSPYIYAVSSHK